MTYTYANRDLAIDPQFALLTITDQKHYHVTDQTHDPIRAGDVIHLVTVQNEGHVNHIRFALCTLTLQITITHDHVVVHGHALDEREAEYFAVGYGFDSAKVLRSRFLHLKNPYSGVLVFWT